MNPIKLGSVLAENRRRCSLTQEALAKHFGVSKATVSKWETGATYPDISLLPQLAAFFNISIDQLMGYQPQMTELHIRQLHQSLCSAFSSEPFSQVMQRCRQISQDYYSCFPLLFQIGSLYVNHCTLAENPEQTNAVLEEARILFQRIKNESHDMNLCTQAIKMEAFCALNLGHPEEIPVLLKTFEAPRMPSEPLLASAHQMLGNLQEANMILQAGIYQSCLELVELLTSYMRLHMQEAHIFEESYRRILSLADAFHLKTLHPSYLLTVYITAAQGFMQLSCPQKALDCLQQYAALATSGIYPLTLHGDSYFDTLDQWIEQQLPLGSAPPRDEALIRRSILEAVTTMPAFTPLQNEPLFQAILFRLQTTKEATQ